AIRLLTRRVAPRDFANGQLFFRYALKASGYVKPRQVLDSPITRKKELRMKRLSPRAMRRRAHVRPTIRLFLEALERREAATDVLNMAAGLGVMASLYAGAAVTPGDPGVIPGVDAVLGAADKPALWDRIPILSTAVAKADEVSVAKQTPSEPPPQS